VPTQVGDLAAVKATSQVLKLQRRAQGELAAVNRLDAPLLSGGTFRVRSWMWITGSWCSSGHRDDDAVPGLPTADRLRQGDDGVAFLRGGAKFDPGAAQGRAVEIHAPTAAHDGWAGLFVQPIHIRQTDQGRVAGVDGLVGGADLQGGPRLTCG